MVSVHRYSSTHVEGQLAIRGRGLFFSRTPDGTWWTVRLRPQRCEFSALADWGDEPPDGGVREPRSPSGRGPTAGTVALDLPHRHQGWS